jgi:glutathione S-transferase
VPDHNWAKAIAATFLDFADQELGSASYATADRPTVADVAAYGYIALAPEGDVSLDPYPAVRAWLQRIESWPRFVPVHRGGLATIPR